MGVDQLTSGGGGAKEIIETQSASGDSFEFTNVFSENNRYEIQLRQLVPDSAGFLRLEFSTDGGGSYLSGYDYDSYGVTANGSIVNDTANGAGRIHLSRGDISTTLGASATIVFEGVADPSTRPVISCETFMRRNSDGALERMSYVGEYPSEVSVDSVKLTANGEPPISSGRATVYEVSE